MDASIESNIPAVLVLAGLPAVGKSTIARLLEQSGEARGETVIWIRFDDDLEASNAINRDTGSFDVASWRESRSAALRRIRDSCTKGQVIIADDNAQYRSMRHTIFRIARDEACAFATVFLELPLEDAIRRNAERPQKERVPEITMRRMATQLEAPDSQKHPWETLAIRLRGDAPHESLQKSIWNLIARARAAGPPARLPTEEEIAALKTKRELAQAQTAANATHAIDLMLRRIVGTVMKSLLEDTDKSQRTALSSLLAQARNKIHNANYSDPSSATLAFQSTVQEALLTSSTIPPAVIPAIIAAVSRAKDADSAR